jgi:ATP-binding cassette subfamily B protein
MTNRALYRRLAHQARPYGLHLVGLFGLGLLASPVALLNPVPLKIVVDSVLGGRPLPAFLRPLALDAAAWSPTAILLFAIGLLLAVAAVGQAQALASTLLRAWVGERLVLDFRARLMDQAQRLSVSYHDSRGTADALYRIQQDAPSIQYILVEGVIPALAAAVTLVTMLAVTAKLDWPLALVAVAISPPLFLVSRVYRPRMRRQSRQAKKLDSSAAAAVQETLGVLRVVKAFGQEARETDRFLSRSREGMAARIGLALLQGRYGLLVGLITALGTAAVLLIGVGHVRAGALTLGQLLIVMGYVGQLYAPLKTIGQKASGLQSYLASAERAFALLDEKQDVPERPDARPIQRAAGAVAVRGVSFAYGPGRPVLHDVSFEVEPGTRLAIVGASGAGKTTLISLLTRFYDPTEGVIRLDGVDLRDYKLDDLRRQFALVPQDPVLFSTSVAENIAYARPGASAGELIAAAQAANAHDFIVRLPQGYKTPVGERGVQLSGGQRQRIAIARAFLKDSPVLILDEPTSAVDQAAEAAIVEAVRRLMRGRTVIVITHRSSLLESCTARVALENGRLVSGTGRVPAVARPAAVRERQAGLLSHPAAQAWRQLSPDSEPHRIVPLRISRRKSTVYRLEGAGPAGCAVVAKQSQKAPAVIERTVYEEILSGLTLPSLRYYGFVEGPDAEHCWLFLEEATGATYSRSLAADREHAGRWLGLLHTSAAEAAARAQLPEGGPGRYREALRSAQQGIRQHLGNPALSADDLDFLEQLLARLAELDADWSRLEEVCDGVPRTLVHGDFNGKNLRLRSASSGTTVLAYDWEEAGWGPPVIDLAQMATPASKLSANPDLPTYWSTVRERWSNTSPESVRRFASCGTVFRALAALSWESSSLDHEWAPTSVSYMRMFEAEIAHALEVLGGAPRSNWVSRS